MSIRNLLEKNFPLGTTEEAPSMEAMLPDLYPGNAEEPVISNEDMASAITTFFGDIKRNYREGKRPNAWRYNIRHVREAVRVYYGNPDWLSRRRFIEKDVKLNDYTAYLVINNQIASADQAKESLDIIKSWFEFYLKYLKQYYAQLEPIARDLMVADVNDDTLKAFTQRLSGIKTPENMMRNELERNFLLPMGRRVYTNNGFTAPVKTSIRRVPALNAEQVLEYSELIMDYLNAMDFYWNASRDLHSNKTVNFASDKGWHGWSQINEYIHGKNNIGKHIQQHKDTRLPSMDNPWLDFGANILKNAAADISHDMLTDETRAKAWMTLLRPFRGNPPPMSNKLKDMMYSIVTPYALWIDSSIR